MSRLVFDGCTLKGSNAALRVLPANPATPRDPITVVLKNIPVIMGTVEVHDASLEVEKVGTINGFEHAIAAICTPEEKGNHHLTVVGPITLLASAGAADSLNIQNNVAVIDSAVLINTINISDSIVTFNNVFSTSNATINSTSGIFNNTVLTTIHLEHGEYILNNCTVGQIFNVWSSVTANYCTVDDINCHQSAVTLNRSTITTLESIFNSAVTTNACGILGLTTVDDDSSIINNGTSSQDILVTRGFAGVYGGQFVNGTIVTGGLMASGVSAGTILAATGASRSSANMWTTNGGFYVGGDSGILETLHDLSTYVGGDRLESTVGTYTIESGSSNIMLQALNGFIELLGPADTSIKVESGTITLTGEVQDFLATGGTVSFTATTVTI